jgi:hypothetical protein
MKGWMRECVDSSLEAVTTARRASCKVRDWLILASEQRSIAFCLAGEIRYDRELLSFHLFVGISSSLVIGIVL